MAELVLAGILAVVGVLFALAAWSAFMAPRRRHKEVTAFAQEMWREADRHYDQMEQDMLAAKARRKQDQEERDRRWESLWKGVGTAKSRWSKTKKGNDVPF